MATGSAAAPPQYQILFSTLPGPALPGFEVKQEFGLVMTTKTRSVTKTGFSVEKIAKYNEEMAEATRLEAVKELERQALALGANAVFGLKFDIETTGSAGSWQTCSAYGTACFVAAKEESLAFDAPPPIYHTLTVRKTQYRP
ncbi:hypothetical protein HK104_010896 [Borealophlyctis nickersoniae]|nr:hypothetical protein HK104_010896 [Borealophlyctis nickersoniae]